MISPFSKVFNAKNPLKPGSIPKEVTGARSAGATKPMSESEKQRMKAAQSVTDKAIKEQDYPGQHGVIIGEGASEMSPLEQGGYEGAADTIGQATYIPTAHMYTDMFNKIGQAVYDIDQRNKDKDNKDKQKEMAGKIGQMVEGKLYTKEMYDAEYGTKPQKYKENEDGTFSLIT